MKKPEWPGIATAVGIIFVLTIIIAVARDPDFKLKDWQTLLAACVALLAATLAYRGAMAKVELDREAAMRDNNRKRAGVYLRLEATLAAIKDHCQDVAKALKKARGTAEWVEPDPVSEVLSSGLQDAWDNLELFPRKLARDIFWVRGGLLSFHDTIARFPEGRLCMDVQDEALRKRLANLTYTLEYTSAACEKVLEWLEQEVESGSNALS